MRSAGCVIAVVAWLALVSPRLVAGDAVDHPTAKAPESSGETAPPTPKEEQRYPIWQGLLDDPLELHRPLNPRTLSDQEKLDAYAYYCVGRLLERRQNNAEALEMYQRALEHDPGAITVYRHVIRLAFHLNRSDEAMRYALKLAELDPSDQLMLRRLAGYLAQPDQGDLEGAIRLLELATQAPNLVHDSPDFVNIMNDLGRLYSATGRNDQAAEAYQKVLEALDNPDQYKLDRATLELLASDRNYEQIGRALLQAGRATDAIRAFEKAEEVAENKGRFSYNLAQVYWQTGEAEKALAELEKYFDQGLGARNPEPYDLVKQILDKLGRSDELISYLERFLKKDSGNSVLQLYLAHEYLAAGKFPEAEKLYSALLESAPQPEAYQGLARVYRETRRPEELLEILARNLSSSRRGATTINDEVNTIASDAALVDSLLETARGAETLPEGGAHVVALIAAAAERVDASAEFFQRAMEEDPDNASLYEEFGQMYNDHQRHEEAAAVYQKALDRNVAPNSPTFHVSLAQSLELAGRTDEAIEAGRGALRINDNLLTRYYFAWIYYHARRFEEARTEYENVLADADESPLAAQDPEFVADLTRRIRFVLSNIELELGNMASAQDILEEILQKEPDDPRANNDLGYLLADQGKDLERSERMIRLAVEKEPKNAAYLDSLGWVLYKRGKFQESIENLEKAIENLDEGDSLIFDHLGDAYLRTDQVEKARSAWQKAIDLYRKQPKPDEKKIEEIQAKLNVTSGQGPIEEETRNKPDKTTQDR